MYLIYSSTALKYKFEVLVLYMSISIYSYFMLLHHISSNSLYEAHEADSASKGTFNLG